MDEPFNQHDGFRRLPGSGKMGHLKDGKGEAMAHIASMEDLLSRWSEVAFSPDPWAALAAAGHVLAPELEATLAREGPARVQNENVLEFLRELQEAGVSLRRSSFRIAPGPQLVHQALPAGHFDVVLSLRLEVVNQVLAGLYATRMWPRDIPPDELGGSVTLQDLRDLSEDIPAAEGLSVGAVHLTAEPTVEVGAEGLVRVAQRLQFDVDVVEAGIRTTTTFLSGVLRYDAQPQGQGENDGAITISFAPPLAVRGDFSVDPVSPIQPRSSDTLSRFSAKIESIVHLLVVTETRGITVDPGLRLPFDASVPVRIVAIRTGTAETGTAMGPIGIGAIHIGVRVVFSDDVDVPASEIPDVVRITDPFGASTINIVTSVHESTLSAAATAMRNSLGETLLAAIRAKVPDVLVRSVLVRSVESELAEPHLIRMAADVSLPNFCGLFHTVDLDLSISADIEMSVFDGTVRLEADAEVDFSNADLVACALGGSLDVAILLIAKIKLLTSDVLHPNINLDSVLDQGPVKFTELAPRAEILQAGVISHRLELRGSVTLLPDTTHIFGYITVHEQRPDGLRPVANAQVRLRDQDAPRPLGDDFVPPPESIEVTQVGGALVTVKRTVELPDRNENLGEAPTITDDDGLARIVVARRRVGGRGATLVSQRTTSFPQTGSTTTTVTRTQLDEQRPDVYIHVTLPDGRRFNSLNPDGTGLLLNLAANHIGSAEAPLDFVVPAP